MDNGNRLIFVSGATGYIGTVLVTELVKRGYRVRAFDTEHFGNAIVDLPNVEFVKADIRDADKVKAALEGVTDVCHLCGVVTDELVDLNKDFAYSVNVQATRDLVEAAYVGQVKRFLYASSSSVYGHAAEGDAPVRENVNCLPKTSYAVQKFQAEQIVLGYASRDFVTSAVRQATACGPAPRMRLDTIVNVFSKQAYFDGKITVHGGGQYRSNVHVQDAAEFYCALLDAPADAISGEAWNVTSGNAMAVEIAGEVAKVARAFGLKPPEIIIQDVKDARSYRLDATKARRILGWRPKRSVADAARDNFEWFRAGRVADPDDPIYRNTARMAELVKNA